MIRGRRRRERGTQADAKKDKSISGGRVDNEWARSIGKGCIKKSKEGGAVAATQTGLRKDLVQACRGGTAHLVGGLLERGDENKKGGGEMEEHTRYSRRVVKTPSCR